MPVSVSEAGRATHVSEVRALRGEHGDLDVAIQRACEMVLARQRADGSWQERADMGPVSTALVLLALSRANALDRTELSEGCRFLRHEQLEDGSFRGRPFAPRGDLGATATAWAALGLSTMPDDRAAAARAQAFVAAHGGLDAVAELSESGDVAPLALAVAGVLSPDRVATPPTWLLTLPQVFERASRRVAFYGLTTLLSTALVVEQLRAKPSRAQALLQRHSRARAVELLTLYQNGNGSLMNVAYHTALLIPALLAAGVAPDDARVLRAIAWLKARGVRGPTGWYCDVYGTDVWSTASYLRVLLEAGLERDHPAIGKAIDWLLAEQGRKAQPVLSNPQKGAQLHGGWGFQAGEEAYPDCDTTSCVLDALGRALVPRRPEARGLPKARARRVCAAIAEARRWLLDMQNPDGGWPSFFWGHPSKRPGPIMLMPPRFRVRDLSLREPSELLRRLAECSEHLGDPATEDVTSRVLIALAQTGSSLHSPEVTRALAFLREQQCPSGAFWGRWKVNYLPCTASVLCAFARLGEDLERGSARRALDWVRSRQYGDGSFGECVETYADPSLAGSGPSNAPVTAAVLLGLVEVGQADGAAAQAAARYLLREQEADGAWPNGECVATLVPPTLFYVYDGAARYMPLEALARYRASLDDERSAHVALD